jgi:hypothetical protein
LDAFTDELLTLVSLEVRPAREKKETITGNKAELVNRVLFTRGVMCVK